MSQNPVDMRRATSCSGITVRATDSIAGNSKGIARQVIPRTRRRAPVYTRSSGYLWTRYEEATQVITKLRMTVGRLAKRLIRLATMNAKVNPIDISAQWGTIAPISGA